MEVLQRLQPLDIVFCIIWAAIVGWGLRTGFVRQLGMLVGVYVAAIACGSLYRQVGLGVSKALGIAGLPQFELFSYVAVFVVTLGLITLIIWRTYPQTRLSRGFGVDNASGAVLAAIWGLLLLIVVLSMLRFYTVVPWREQQATQQGILREIEQSEVAPVLQVVMAPLWQLIAPWFPEQIKVH